MSEKKEERKCCEKCWSCKKTEHTHKKTGIRITTAHRGTAFCTNSECPCHTPSANVEETVKNGVMGKFLGYYKSVTLEELIEVHVKELKFHFVEDGMVERPMGGVYMQTELEEKARTLFHNLADSLQIRHQAEQEALVGEIVRSVQNYRFTDWSHETAVWEQFKNCADNIKAIAERRGIKT